MESYTNERWQQINSSNAILKRKVMVKEDQLKQKDDVIIEKDKEIERLNKEMA